MFQTFKNAWKIDELRKKIIFTLFILLIFRLGAAIPAPFINAAVLATSSLANKETIFGFFDLMTGGSFSNATLFALSVTPYINASIIIQLLQVVIPALERWSKEGEEGRNKINKLTRYSSIFISLSLAIVYYILLQNQGALTYNFSDGFAGVFSAIVIVMCLTGGSVLLIWLGEQIDQKGIGSGISLLIFTGIIANLSKFVQTFIYYFQLAAGKYMDPETGTYNTPIPSFWVILPLILIMFAAMFVFIIVMTNAERRIPVQYAKRVVGRKMYGGQNTNIPIKVNMTGVLPIIFASTFLSVPATIKNFFSIDSKFLSLFDPDGWLYAVLYALLIIGFNYFYVAVQYNPIQMANDLRKNSGMIPGIRPGKPTTDFISRVISKITFIGGIFLVLVATLPIIIANTTGIQISLGGTSVLIIVGVALEISNTLESYMLMRHHKGFLE